jgi:hypothetical protein
MAFLKPDMRFVHYRWITDEQPASEVYQGEPTRRPFDPFNGDQVLFLINYYDTVVGGLTIKQARALESKLAYQLPMEIKSERSVFSWLMAQSLEESDSTDQ